MSTTRHHSAIPFAHKPETRLTDWVPFGRYGFSHYRIWVHYDSMLWWQRHEWKREDGSINIEDWIRSIPGFPRQSKPYTETLEKL